MCVCVRVREICGHVYYYLILHAPRPTVTLNPTPQLTTQQLADRLHPPSTTSSSSSAPPTFTDIRHAAAAYLRAHRDDFMPFLDLPPGVESDGGEEAEGACVYVFMCVCVCVVGRGGEWGLCDDVCVCV
jgi:hypothetical protein